MAIVNWPDLSNVDNDPPPEKTPESNVPDDPENPESPWGLVGREYGKFDNKTKAFIRWGILIVGIFFALSYISE